MTDPGWTDEGSPFHRGERALQEFLGVRDELEFFGRRGIRNYLPTSHREFFFQQPFVAIGTIDADGRPWASLIVAKPGFIRTPEPTLLTITLAPVFGDSLSERLSVGAEVAVLGIEFHSRRRNTVTGKVTALNADEFEIRVDQSFGNCPRFINARELRMASFGRHAGGKSIHRSDRLRDADRVLVGSADTFFIVSHFSDSPGDPTQGVDISHRGGEQGFVRTEGENTITWPEFVGNYHFSTLGNLLVNPKAGLLFINFETGDRLYMTGRAELVWPRDEENSPSHTGLGVRFQLEELVRVEESFSIGWGPVTHSPSLKLVSLPNGPEALGPGGQDKHQYLPFIVTRVELESETISSFYLEPGDGAELAPFKPGQNLPIKLEIPEQQSQMLRTYTISDAPNGRTYRLSIKREGAPIPELASGIVSSHFHDHIKPGARIFAKPPQGKFVLDSSERPLVLLSGGVGITPMIAMINHLASQGGSSRLPRDTWFIHGALNGRTHAFADHVRFIAAKFGNLNVHFRYSAPSEEDKTRLIHDSEGLIDIDFLNVVLAKDDYEFYLCGPPPFMASLFRGLRELGVARERIHCEFFGPPLSLVGTDSRHSETTTDHEPEIEAIKVEFAKSGMTVLWDPSKGTLLELAEEHALRPAYGCRSGMCGGCVVKILSGEVENIRKPIFEVKPRQVLICFSIPKTRDGIVLDV